MGEFSILLLVAAGVYLLWRAPRSTGQTTGSLLEPRRLLLPAPGRARDHAAASSPAVIGEPDRTIRVTPQQMDEIPRALFSLSDEDRLRWLTGEPHSEYTRFEVTEDPRDGTMIVRVWRLRGVD